MTSRSAVKMMLCFVLGLPVLLAVLHWVVGLLGAMGDETAAGVLQQMSTGIGVLWLVSVVGLVVSLAFEALDEQREE